MKIIFTLNNPYLFHNLSVKNVFLIKYHSRVSQINSQIKD